MEEQEIQTIQPGRSGVRSRARFERRPISGLRTIAHFALICGLAVGTLTGGRAAFAQGGDGAGAGVQQLGSVDDDARAAARDALVEAGDASIPALIEGLDDPNSLVRWGACRILGEIGSVEASPALVERLQDDDEYSHVQRAAAVALGRCGGDNALEVLRTYMEKDPTIGAEALGYLGDTSILPELLNFLLDLEEDYRRLKLARGTQRELVLAQEPKVAGSIAIVAAAICRLDCRGGVPSLIDSLKFTEWIGMYARSEFIDYLGDDMPRVFPGAKRNENIDTLQVHSAIARFFDDHIDTYIHPAELEDPDPALADKCRRIVQVIGEGTSDAQQRRVDVLTGIGKPILPLLVSEYSDPESPAYLSDNVVQALYLMGGSLRVARTPRLVRRVFDDLSNLIPAIEDTAAKAGLVRLMGEYLHWWPFEVEIVNYSSAYTEDVFAGIVQIRQEGKEFLLSMLESEEPEVKVAALEALIKIGDEEFADPVGEVFSSTENDAVRIAAIRSLEWIRYESGRAMLQVLDVIEGDYSDDVRLAAASSLARLEDPTRAPLAGLPALLDFLKSENPDFRARAVESLRIATDRYFGFDPQGSAAERAEAVARWTSWADANLDSFRPDIFGIRKRQFDYYNSTLRQYLDMATDLRRFAGSAATTASIREFKNFYRHQFRFLPFLVEHYGEVDESLHPMISNLIASRFDKPTGLPFLVSILENRAEADPLVLVNVLDTIGLFPEHGLLQAEAQALVSPVAAVFEDESMARIVRITAADTLARLGDARGVDLLIANLTLDESVENAGWLRDESFDVLRKVARMAGQRGDFGYEPNAPAVVREKAAAAWSEWWNGKRDSVTLRTLIVGDEN